MGDRLVTIDVGRNEGAAVAVRPGLKCAGSHRVADPSHFDLPGFYRVSQSLVYRQSRTP